MKSTKHDGKSNPQSKPLLRLEVFAGRAPRALEGAAIHQSSPESTIVGFLPYEIEPLLLPVASRALTIFIDSSSDTSPKTTWRPSSQLVLTVVTKNWEPFLYGKMREFSA